MSEENAVIPPDVSGGFGGNLFDRPQVRAAELNLVRRAVNNGWNVKPEVKKKILDRAELLVDDQTIDDDIFIKASKLIMDADKIDAARERTQVEAKHHETLEATAILRAAMQGDDVREQLAALSDRVCEQFPIAVQAEVAAIQQDNAEEVLEGIAKIPAQEHKNGNGKP